MDLYNQTLICNKPLPTFIHNSKFNNLSSTSVSSVLFSQKFSNVRLYSTPTGPVVPPVVPPVVSSIPPPPTPPTPVLPSETELTQVIDLLKTSLEQPPSVLEHRTKKFNLQHTHLTVIYPTEWWRSFMTFMHDNVGLPWWATLCTMAFVTRLFTLPLSVRTMRNAPKMKARTDEMNTVMQEMKIASQLGYILSFFLVLIFSVTKPKRMHYREKWLIYGILEICS
jgi:hypothetical protein